jgi:hypothetical protein
VPVEHEVGAIHAIHLDRLVEGGLVLRHLVDSVRQGLLARMEAAIEIGLAANGPHDVGDGDRRLGLELRMSEAQAPSDLVEHEEVAAAAGSAESHGRSVSDRCS